MNPLSRAWKRWSDRLTVRLGWSEFAPPAVLRNLRWFWFDGVFSQASEAIVNAYLSLFILALGASRVQIGLLNAVSNLSAALVMLPGAALVDRWSHRREVRKELCVWSGGGLARLILLLLALTPLLSSGAATIYVIIALVVLRVALTNLTVPAWVSLTADLVPLPIRGRYFGFRNMAMGLAGMLTAFLMGQLINRLGSPLGYQWAMGLAFAIGMASTWSFARIHEPPSQTAARPSAGSLWSVLRELRSQPQFIKWCAIDALWNFSLNVAGPFFGVYLVEQLGATAGFVGVLTVINVMASMPGQRWFGTLADRWGPRRVQMLVSLLIPLVPLGWSLARQPWQVIPAEIASGFLWAGYSVASFNLLLLMMPERRRAHYTALYQIVVMAALAAGAAIGGLIATWWGYRTILVISGVGRLTAALLFALFVRLPAAPGKGSVAPDPPAQDSTNRDSIAQDSIAQPLPE